MSPPVKITSDPPGLPQTREPSMTKAQCAKVQVHQRPFIGHIAGVFAHMLIIVQMHVLAVNLNPILFHRFMPLFLCRLSPCFSLLYHVCAKRPPLFLLFRCFSIVSPAARAPRPCLLFSYALCLFYLRVCSLCAPLFFLPPVFFPRITPACILLPSCLLLSPPSFFGAAYPFSIYPRPFISLVLFLLSYSFFSSAFV